VHVLRVASALLLLCAGSPPAQDAEPLEGLDAEGLGTPTRAAQEE